MNDSNASLAQDVIALIAESQYLDPASISTDSTFEELGIDSLGGLAIVADLEKAYQIAIPNEQALLIRDIRGTIECLQRLLPSVASNARNAT